MLAVHCSYFSGSLRSVGGDVDVHTFCLRLLIIYTSVVAPRPRRAKVGLARRRTCATVRRLALRVARRSSCSLHPSANCTVYVPLSPLIERDREGEGPHYGLGIRPSGMARAGLAACTMISAARGYCAPRGWLRTVRVNDTRTWTSNHAISKTTIP